MFELEDVVKYISFLTYLGFFVSSITGLIELKKEFNTCILLTSCVVLVGSILFSYIDICNFINNIIHKEKNIYYIRSLFIFTSSLLILGVSNIGLGFGIMGFVVSIINLICGLLTPNKVEITYNSSRYSGNLNGVEYTPSPVLSTDSIRTSPTLINGK